MSGLPLCLLFWMLASLLLGGAAVAAEAQPPGGPPDARSVVAQRADGPDVDAFLGLWRSARIAQVIPDHARQCLPSAGGLVGTDAQRAIAASVAFLAESPLGAWLIEEAAARLVLICQDPHTDLAAYYRAQMRLIGLFERLPQPAKLMFLAHELAHVPQHPRFSNDLRLGAQGVVVVHRVREASAEAVATRVLWQLRARGHDEPWHHKLSSAYGDIARAFARVMQEPGEARELRATRAAFDQWFGRPERVHSYDARILGYLARTDTGGANLAHPTRRLSERFVRGIGWYAGETFMAPADGPILSDPYYAHGLSPANAARLERILRRAM